ncbi:MAG: GIY-YIG nuclease family protein [Burkholderiales bacterium]|nr:GIY-YIG nuclease family protein [Burkholderiales bacterium]
MRARVTSVGLIVPHTSAENFSPPSHIDAESLDALPSMPGVYIFVDHEDTPIYIGKSVNIRSRVHAHLRTPEEAAMLAETRRVDFLRTAGEIGALLLESHLIKKHQPAYNVLLKYEAESFTLCLRESDTQPHVVTGSEVRDADTVALYGLFASRSAAQEKLEELVRENHLCPALLGLEVAIRGRACFAHQIGRCLGACVGKESKQAHLQRLMIALERLNDQVWPYFGPIGIIETESHWRQVHVVNRWAYLGTLEGRRKQLRLPAKRAVDIDTYKILARPLAEGRLTIAPCEVRQSKAGSPVIIFSH